MSWKDNTQNQQECAEVFDRNYTVKVTCDPFGWGDYRYGRRYRSVLRLMGRVGTWISKLADQLESDWHRRYAQKVQLQRAKETANRLRAAGKK